MYLILRKLTAFFISVVLILVIFFLLFVGHAGAQQAQNIYGIHITDKEDIPAAAKLVNGETGAWGYVTLVIQSDDRKIDKWQPIFHDLMEYKLQPIVRIASKVDGPNWARPTEQDAKDWAEFLSALYWPTDRKIVSVYNEVNHGQEWGGVTDPASYAKALAQTIEALKAKDSDFFVLHAAFDQASPQQPPAFMDAGIFMEEMEKAVPGIFNRLDGWASHSYPNPGFAGKPTDTGKATIRGYDWELNFIRTKFNVTKQLPVFIKETGWPYKDSMNPRTRYDLETAKEYTLQAFDQVWTKDPRIAAVTPFILRYRTAQFSHFSWFTQDNQETSMYQAIAALPKVAGNPQRSFDAKLEQINIPSQIPYNREITATIVYRNIGARPWNVEEKIVLRANDEQKAIVRDNFRFDENAKVMPGQAYSYRFTLKAPIVNSKVPITLRLSADETMFGEKLFAPLTVYTPPVISLVAENMPEEEPLNKVVVGIKDKNGQSHIFDPIDIPQNGMVGNFEHPMFVPNIPMNVVVALPERDRVSIVVTPTSGTNEVKFSVPERKSPFVLFAENFARSMRRR